jgi:MerR family transcriptional regulator, light-induced transcriptional regulator
VIANIDYNTKLVSRYSISDLEKLTGIKAHTIRIWEQRYALVVPSRTDTKIRYFNDEDVRMLMNVALLNKHGLKISKIARLSQQQITDEVAGLTTMTVNSNSQIDALILAMVHMDELEAESIFGRFMQDKGFESTMSELVYPFLDKLNVLWLTGSIQQAHERFISNLIKRKIILAIEQHTAKPIKEKGTFLLYLRDGESQELTVLYMHYLLRARGCQVINLGTGVTLTDVATACQAAKPNYIFSVFNDPIHRQSFQSYIDGLSKCINGSRMLITGHQVFSQHIKFTHQFVVLNSLSDAMLLLNQIDATAAEA